MPPLPQPLYDEVTAALRAAGRAELAERLRPHQPRNVLSSGQAAAMLGVSSTNTVKNWLHSGIFPGAYKTAGGHWRFPIEDVEAAKRRMDELRERNRAGDLTPADLDDEAPAPPLL